MTRKEYNMFRKVGRDHITKGLSGQGEEVRCYGPVAAYQLSLWILHS